MGWACYEDGEREDSKEIYVVEATGKETIGRPRKRWLDWVDEAFKRKGYNLTQVDGSETGEDRNNWREIVRCFPTDR